MSRRRNVVASSITTIMLTIFFLHYYRIFQFTDDSLSDDSPLWKYNLTQPSYPNTAFFHDFAKYYQWMDKLQANLDKAAGSRQAVIGNIAWYPSQVYYYGRFASLDWVSNICEIGYGAGHSTILYFAMNSKAHIYSFDLFPNNMDGKADTIGETIAHQQAFQAVTLKAIENDPKLAVRFHKVIGNSNITVPRFIKENPNLKCDFLSIDGSHNPPQPFFDIMHSQSLAHNETIVLLDDMQESSLKAELHKAVQLEILHEYECLKPEFHLDIHFASTNTDRKEFCAARYRNVGDKRS